MFYVFFDGQLEATRIDVEKPKQHISIVPYSICPNYANVALTGYKICLGAPVRTFDICTLQLEINFLLERKLSDRIVWAEKTICDKQQCQRSIITANKVCFRKGCHNAAMFRCMKLLLDSVLTVESFFSTSLQKSLKSMRRSLCPHVYFVKEPHVVQSKIQTIRIFLPSLWNSILVATLSIFREIKPSVSHWPYGNGLTSVTYRHLKWHIDMEVYLALIASRISWICRVSAGAQGQASGAFCFLNVGTVPVSPMYPWPWQGHKSDSSRQDPPRGIQLAVGQDIQKHTETAASAAWSNHVAAKWNRDSSGLKEMMTITCGHLLWPITARAINKYTGQSVIKLQTVQGITCSASAHTMLSVGSHVITSCQAETHKALKWCPWVLHLQWLSLTLVFCELCISFSHLWTCYFLNLQWYRMLEATNHS